MDCGSHDGKVSSRAGKGWEQDPNFDGTLRHSNLLAKVLKMPPKSEPRLYPSKIVGYSCKLLGPYLDKPINMLPPEESIVYGVSAADQSNFCPVWLCI